MGFVESRFYENSENTNLDSKKLGNIESNHTKNSNNANFKDSLESNLQDSKNLSPISEEDSNNIVETNLSQHSQLHSLNQSIPTRPPTCKIKSKSVTANVNSNENIESRFYENSKNDNLDSKKLGNIESNHTKDSKKVIESNFLSPIKRPRNFTQNNHGIVIYNEGRQYFSVFHPIVAYLESINYPYTYYTSSENDPLLRLSNKSQNIIEFIGDSNKAYLKLNALKADIVLMTTPQLDVLQIKRSKGVEHYCHIIHSLPHVDIYEIFALDYFDSVFTNSPIHTDFIRLVEQKRGLKRKKVVITGCTYLDFLDLKLRRLLDSNKNMESKKMDSPIPCGEGLGGWVNSTSQNNKIINKQEDSTKTQNLDSNNAQDSNNVKEDSKSLTPNQRNISEKDSIQHSHSQTSYKSIPTRPPFFKIDTKFESANAKLNENTESNLQDSILNAAHHPTINIESNKDFIYDKTFKDSNKKIVLISPSWGREALLSKYGMAIIKPLLESNFNVIIRPHPQSLIAEKPLLDSIKEQTKGYANIAYDTNIDNIYAMQVADIMLGDFSGILFDFLCLFEKPLAVMEFHFNIIGYDLEDIYDTPWVKGALAKIAKNISVADLPALPSILESALNDKSLQNNIKEMKSLLWKYQGRSAEITALELLKIHKEILLSRLDSNIYHNLRFIDDVLDFKENIESNHTTDSKKVTESTILSPTHHPIIDKKR
ncbi:hypothetical protein DCO58_02690 [Helicobacter saguini]|uniref:CDP-glycerol--glycerophosphate glycerophosphotransferase n=1 Tax=Helicobacter saguini TaxID=1548018 RepID=A0A4U8T3R1_9HELI|nr:CDP-glycerol glycerophosphotransferase family protein [Helicobacter saguini]MWV62715.1 hypothetical protein [Helicobacter saguini]MWV66614.1 hypothetical protein [Helicobacter saguini]TLD94125.1 hypothetical protein LS64_007410 [Helicobacter saguini]